MDSSEKAILKTLLYSDIFDYPLSEEEVWRFLISDEHINESSFRKHVERINSVVYRKNGFLFVGKNERNVQKRIRRSRVSQDKLNIAIQTIEKLFLVPTVKLIGISGNLSMMNAGKKDDIDLFVIAKKDTAWITRLLLIIYLKLMGKHRSRKDTRVENKFCLNMIIDEESLPLPKNKRNIYTAHEIVQLRPVMQRENVYKRFINSNYWITDYMPNALRELRGESVRTSGNFLFEKLAERVISFFIVEKFAKNVQIFIMKRNLTTETVGDKIIALHPKDYNSVIPARYKEKIVKYGLQI